MTFRPCAALLAAALSTSLLNIARADDWKFHGIGDGNIYTKPYTNLQGKWKEEFGIAAPLLTNGPWVVKWNVGYLQTYPLKWKEPQLWTAGVTAVYEFGNRKDQIRPGLYTKLKKDDPGRWQQETGLTARTRFGRYGLTGNLGYIFEYPRHADAIPKWQAGVSFCWYFK